MGITLVKTNNFPNWFICKYWRIYGAILRLTSVILNHIEKRKIIEMNGKSSWNGFSLGLRSDQVALKSQVSLSRSFLAVFSFSFNVSADIVRMFLSYSMIIVFPWLLKSWSCLLKCLQAGIELRFLTAFLWLLSLL